MYQSRMTPVPKRHQPLTRWLRSAGALYCARKCKGGASAGSVSAARPSAAGASSKRTDSAPSPRRNSTSGGVPWVQVQPSGDRSFQGGAPPVLELSPRALKAPG